MENPATWGPAEKVIDQAIKEHENAQKAKVCGPSLPKRIIEKLKAAGLLKQGDA